MLLRGKCNPPLAGCFVRRNDEEATHINIAMLTDMTEINFVYFTKYTYESRQRNKIGITVQI